MSESDSRMSKSYIKQIIEVANELDHLLNPEQDLEDWVDAKITRARNDLSDVLGYLKHYPEEVVENSKKSLQTTLVAKKLRARAKKIIFQLKK